MALPARGGVSDKVNSVSFNHWQWNGNKQPKDRGIDFLNDARLL
jgi:hypothetical protein